jgi:hypothetical protein
MTTITTKLKEIANPSAVAWEWSDTYQGIEYEGVEGTYVHQILWLRGTEDLFYVTQAPQKEWGPWVPITLPERFGFDGTLQGARAAAQAFYNEGKEQ